MITVSLESVLSKLMLLGSVKLRTLGKAAMMAKRVARASSLRSAEPAFNLPIPFSGSSFMGAQNPEYMAPIGQPIETLDKELQRVVIGGGGDRETPPRGLCLTGQPIKNYGPTLHVMDGGGAKFHPAFL